MRKLIIALLGIAACSTTSILSTWTKPGVTSLKFSKVLVVAPMKDDTLRRSSEDQIVSSLAPGVGVPSYRLLPAGSSADALKAAVATGGYDGAIIMKVRSVKKEATWVPGDDMDMYAGFGDVGWYGGMGYGMGYDPGYVAVDTYVRVDTSIYALPASDLLWSASSRTADPTSVKELVSDVVNTLRTELKNEGLTPMPVSSRATPARQLASH